MREHYPRGAARQAKFVETSPAMMMMMIIRIENKLQVTRDLSRKMNLS